MRCKVGDLAIVVKSLAGNEGKIVRCVQYIGVVKWKVIGMDDTWLLDQPLKNIHGHSGFDMPDSFLRPIRDNPGQDETLQWAPHKETA